MPDNSNLSPVNAPNVTVNIPPVQAISPINGGQGFASPEQQLVQAQQMGNNMPSHMPGQAQLQVPQPTPQQAPLPGNMQAGPMNVPPGVNVAIPGQHVPTPQAPTVVPPTPQYTSQIGATPQVPMAPAPANPLPAPGAVPQQQQMPAQAPGMAPGAVEQGSYEIDPGDFPGASEGVLQVLVDDAVAAGVPAHELGGFVNQKLQEGAGSFGDGETFVEYRSRADQLTAALTEEYGQEGAQEVLGTVVENLRNTGGDAMVHKFLTDPAMLDPEIVGNLLQQSPNAANPYSKFFNRGGGAVRAPAASDIGNNVNLHGAQNIDERIAFLYRPENREYLKTSAGSQELVALFSEKTRTANPTVVV